MGKNRRKRSRGEGSVYRYLTTGGKNVRYRAELPGGKAGKAGFATEAEAVAWLRANRDRAPAAGTVGDWLTRWLELHRADWKPRSYRRIAFSVGRWLAPALGPIPLRDLTGVHAREMLAGMAREGAKDAERHKAGAHLRQALNAAVALGVLGRNPMTDPGRVRLPSPRHPEKKALDAGQIAALVGAADGQGKGAQVRLWLDAGPRPSELLGLDWEDIDARAGTVRVVRAWDSLNYVMTETKTKGSRRTIRLSEGTVGAVRAVGGSGPFLKPPRSERYWQSEFWRAWWRPLLAAAGLGGQGFGPYTVRHTMATHLLRSGVPILTVSRRLGHSSARQTLETYAHLLEGDDDRAAEVMGRLIAG